MQSVALYPGHNAGHVKACGILAHIAHKDAFEATEVALNGLAHVDNAIAVAQVVQRIIYNLLGILQIEAVAIMII